MNGFEPILLQIGPISEVAEGPGERIAEIDAGGDCMRAVIWRYYQQK